MDNCHVGAIEFGEMDDLDLEGTEVLHPEYGTRPHVFYRNLPKKFIAGTVYDPEAEEIIEGASVTAEGEEGSFAATTDSWGDFWLRGLPDGDWKVTIAKDGKQKVLEASTRKEDVGLGDVALA